MNKLRLNLIVQSLLLPFIEEEFLEQGKDCIESVAEAYYCASHTDITQINQRKRCERQYNGEKKKLEQFICSSSRLGAKSIDDVLLIIELFYPQADIAIYLQKHLKNEEDGRESIVSQYYIKRLFHLAVSLLTFRDGRIAVRTWLNDADEEGYGDLFGGHDAFDKVEIWNTMSRLMVPDVVIAAFFIEAGLTDRMYLYNQNGGIFLADKTLDKVLQRGIAETHMHFNVGLEYTVLWRYVTNYWRWEGYFTGKLKWSFGVSPVLLFRCVIFRLFFAGYLEWKEQNKKELADFWKYIEKTAPKTRWILYEIMESLATGSKEGSLSDYREFYLKLLSEIRASWGRNENTDDFLLDTVYQKDKGLKTSSEMIFLTQALKWVRAEENPRESRLLLQYIRIRNLYFKQIVQPNHMLGLNYFQQYFSSARKAERFGTGGNPPRFYQEIFRSQSHNINLKKLELRVTPSFEVGSRKGMMDYSAIEHDMKLNLLKSIEMIMEEYIGYCRDMAGISSSETLSEQELDSLDYMYHSSLCGFPSIGIVFHFQKAEYLDNKIGDMCWVKYSRTGTAPAYSKHLLVWRNQMVNCAKAIEELRGEVPYLAEYVVGIDAASNECNTEPWLLAPVYREIRNRKRTRPLILNKENLCLPIPNIGFTYHVGEEFRHILSGLRHIDEVIEHFRYKAGDRLGHAIALGENVDFWVKENEVAVLPAMEHLENLLWLWGSIVHGRLDIRMMMEELEGRIMMVAEEIFGNRIQGLTSYMLYEAYREKFKQNHEEVFESCQKLLSDDYSEMDEEEHFCRLFHAKNSNTGILWTKEKLLCTYYCPHHYLKFQRPLFVTVREEETELYRSIQAQLIKKVETGGIYVETNPTSNTAIGQMDSLFTHYIMNLNATGLKKQEEGHAVLVTINSDDPVVFNTNAENELAYIYHALVHKGYEKERILSWMDKVRQFGLDSSFVQKAKSPSIQIREMEQILNFIREYRKHGRI